MNTGCCGMYLLNFLFSKFSVSVSMVRVETVKYGSENGSGNESESGSGSESEK